MTHDTLFTSYEAIDHYFQLIEKATGTWPIPPIRMKPLDVYLIQQIIARYPVAPTVIDCSAELTWGASTILCLDLMESLNQLISISSSTDRSFLDLNPHFDWSALLKQLTAKDADDLAGNFEFIPDIDLSVEEHIQRFYEHVPRTMPILILSYLADEPAVLQQRILQLAKYLMQAVFIVGPIYKSQHSEHLYSLLGLQHDHGFNFRLLKEENAFLRGSEIALVYKDSAAPYLTDVIGNLRLMFEGNFDFLPLLESNLVLQQSNMRYKDRVEQLTQEIIHLRSSVSTRGVTPSASLPKRIYQAVLPLGLRRRLQIGNRLVGIYQRIVPLGVRTRWYNARHRK
ncbi:MAG: hypothetical protein H6670_17745 [Anaerolineaceae bacterium]|nr:hypothetical protein [Anaerolineaceae bacterium]